MKPVVWVIFGFAFALQWYKRWLVVRDYSKRPLFFMISGRSGILIIAGWVAMIGALVLLAVDYSLFVAVVMCGMTGIVLHILTRIYFYREVKYWSAFYLDKMGIKTPYSAKDHKDAYEWARETVLRIRENPIGKG